MIVYRMVLVLYNKSHHINKCQVHYGSDLQVTKKMASEEIQPARHRAVFPTQFKIATKFHRKIVKMDMYYIQNIAPSNL